MSGRGDYEGAVRAGQQLVTDAAETAVKRALHARSKPTLRRYTWSRLHSDLLDDNRWALVAYRAKAPLPMVEALVARLEIHANKSDPRGYVGDFDPEAMAVRWGVDIGMVARIFDELEHPRIGWIDQDQIVSFWGRNPDKVDETAAERKRRQRDREKAAKLLAQWTRQGLISEEARREREAAMRGAGCDVAALIREWRASVMSSVTVTRDTVTVTPRAEQIIDRERAVPAEKVSSLGANLTPIDPAVFADGPKALQWLKGDGEALITSRLGAMRHKAIQQIERWDVTLCHDATALARIVYATLATEVRGEAFKKLVTEQVARQAAGLIAPGLPLPPVPIHQDANGASPKRVHQDANGTNPKRVSPKE